MSNASNGSAIRFNNLWNGRQSNLDALDKYVQVEASKLWETLHYRVYSTNTRDIRNMSIEIGPIHPGIISRIDEASSRYNDIFRE